MLGQLDSVPWAELQHAYGNASDVPSLIRSLCSAAEEARTDARRSLCERINHQGSVYQATSFAIPFLFELVQDPHVVDRHLLMYNLVGIAIGVDADYLPYDFNLATFRNVLKSRAAKLSKVQRTKAALGPHIDLACYEAINDCTDVFVRLLSNAFTNIRIAAAFALCWFPECQDSLPLLKQRLETVSDHEEKELANVALAYGLLSYHSGQVVEPERLLSLLEHRTLFVRVAAAISVAKTVANARTAAVLSEGAKSDELLNIYETTPFNEGNLCRYAEKVLGQITEA